MTTMDEKYGDGSDCVVCKGCGLCISCGDCKEHGCGEEVQECKKDSESTAVAGSKPITEETIRDVATEFFYSWYNSPGTNTLQGFDDWWKLNAARFGF